MTEKRKKPISIIVIIVAVVAICVSGWSIYKGIQKEREESASGESNPAIQKLLMADPDNVPEGVPNGKWIASFKHSIELTRSVRNLLKLEEQDTTAFSHTQAVKLLPILTKLKNAEKIPEEEAKTKLAVIKEILTKPQLDLLEELTPPLQIGQPSAMGVKPRPSDKTKNLDSKLIKDLGLFGNVVPEANLFKSKNNRDSLITLIELLKKK